MEDKMTDKFWLINDFQKLLLNTGMEPQLIDLVTFCTLIIILMLIIRIINYIGGKLIINVLHLAVKHTKTRWDDFLANRHFFRRSISFVISLLLIYLTDILMKGYNESMVKGALIIIKCVAVFFIINVFMSIVNAASDIYNTLPRSKERSIKGYIQTIKIMVYIVGILFCISIIMDIDLSKILLGLATSAAILTLVFKDTILGFIASIQLSSQDMVRLGDWIQMPAKGADGTVIDMTVNTVKIQNWDNTISMLPIYTLVSESFINWRGMQESDGRRFKKPFLIDVNSIKQFTPLEVEQLKNNDIIAPHYDMMLKYKTESQEKYTTNLSLYRAFMKAYLQSSEYVNCDLMLLVRYLPMSGLGMPIEIYGFTKEKRFVEYEDIVNILTEDIVSAAPVLSIRLFQYNTTIFN